MYVIVWRQIDKKKIEKTYDRERYKKERTKEKKILPGTAVSIILIDLDEGFVPDEGSDSLSDLAAPCAYMIDVISVIIFINLSVA